jgi:hypothetical protein
VTYAVSVSQLLAMKPGPRAKAIAALPEGSRVRLAHLASLGLRRELAKASEYQAILESLTRDDVFPA